MALGGAAGRKIGDGLSRAAVGTGDGHDNEPASCKRGSRRAAGASLHQPRPFEAFGLGGETPHGEQLGQLPNRSAASPGDRDPPVGVGGIDLLANGVEQADSSRQRYAGAVRLAGGPFDHTKVHQPRQRSLESR